MFPRLAKRIRDYDPTGFETPGYAALREKYMKAGAKLINFSIGDPVSPRGYETPAIVREELVESFKQARINYAGYAGGLPYPGSPVDLNRRDGVVRKFKEAIIRREKIVHDVTYDPNNLHICGGAGEGISYFFFAVANPKDEWLCCEPIYGNYIAVHSYPAFGFKWVGWKQDEEKGWTPDLDELRSKVTEKSTCISLVNPCNPTGTVFSEKILKGIVNIAGEYELLIQVDEVMDVLLHDGSISTSIAEVAGDVPTIVINGFSKSMLCPGLRVGWLCIHDPEDKILEIRNGLKKLPRILGNYPVATPIMMGATNILNKMTDFQEHLKPAMDLVKKRADYTYKRINEIEALSMVPIKAGFWGFAKYEGLGTVWKSDEEMRIDLLQHGGGNSGVVITGGPTWGSTYALGHFRIPAFESEDVLEEGFDRLEDFFRIHARADL